MKIADGLDHFAIAAENTDQTVSWYGRVLGLVVHKAVEPKPPLTQKIYLIGPPAEAGGTGPFIAGSMIEVMPRNEMRRQQRDVLDPGLSHVAWRVDDFDAALAHLKTCEVRFLGETVQAVGGGRLISFADCDGNMMQIVERRAEE